MRNLRASWQLWKGQNKTTRQILEILILVALLSSGVGALLSGDWPGLLLNFGTEMAGAVVTFVLIEQIIGAGKKKSDLIAQLGSTINEEAKRAVEELRRHGWLKDGSLKGLRFDHANFNGALLSQADFQGAKLVNANLQNADLRMSNLEAADLSSAHMQAATLRYANLQRADLRSAKLEQASLGQADLRKANLQSAILRGADLQEANLEGTLLKSADLTGANLRDANLQYADLGKAPLKLDETTILPDGTSWTPETSMMRFVDPASPDFWRSSDPLSPAYRKS
jgi:uncharacterized protein YjbI with pentapeptide repeats